MWGGRRINNLHTCVRRFILLGRGHTEADLKRPELSNSSELLRQIQMTEIQWRRSRQDETNLTLFYLLYNGLCANHDSS
jgi:hypothetical protein